MAIKRTNTHRKQRSKAKHLRRQPSPCASSAATSCTTECRGTEPDHSHRRRPHQPRPAWIWGAGRTPNEEQRQGYRGRAWHDQWRSEAPRRSRPSWPGDSQTARSASASGELGFASGRWRWAWGWAKARARMARASGESEGPGLWWKTTTLRAQLGRSWFFREAAKRRVFYRQICELQIFQKWIMRERGWGREWGRRSGMVGCRKTRLRVRFWLRAARVYR